MFSSLSGQFLSLPTLNLLKYDQGSISTGILPVLCKKSGSVPVVDRRFGEKPEKCRKMTDVQRHLRYISKKVTKKCCKAKVLPQVPGPTATCA